MNNNSLLTQKRNVYQTSWVNYIAELETLKLKLNESDQEKLDAILAELEMLIQTATNNVTLAPDAGI